MTTDEILERILSEHPEIGKTELCKRLRDAKKKTGGLIREEILLQVIAAELGINLPQESVYDQKLSISRLVPGLYDVTVSGRIIAIYPSKAFKGKSRGKFASVLIAEDDVLRVMLWNDQTKFVDSGILKAGETVRFCHGYTREGREGKTELHIGSKSEIELNPSDLDPADYPTVLKFATKINEIVRTPKSKKVHVVGTVNRIFPASSFTRRDLSLGSVMRMDLADTTGKITVVAWNQKADFLEGNLKENMKLQLVNARVKVNLNGIPEIHVDESTYVATSPPDERLTKIANLKEGLGKVCVTGEVLTKPTIKEVNTYKGEKVKLATFKLKDETGAILVLAWRHHAETVNNLMPGDRIMIENAYSEKGLDNKTELSTKPASSIILL